MVAGILLTTGGAVGLIAGSALLSSANDRFDVYCDDGNGPYACSKKNDTGRATAGGVMMIVGGVALAGGIPLWIIGARMVPVNNKEPAPPTPATPGATKAASGESSRWGRTPSQTPLRSANSWLAASRPTLLLCPTGGGVRFRF